jgi:preprotein translocase subunit SecA
VPAIIDSLLRAGEGKTLRKLKAIVSQVNSIEDDFRSMTDAELRAMTGELKQRHADGQTLDELMPEAFATVREAATRVLGQRHFDVQLMGGAALHFGNIAEMKTGEGKTLTAVLPSYLNALGGQGVHVVTVNDYLARYHAEWMGRIHRFLGLEVGVILANMDPDERRKQYAADVTYGTNNEFGFDYLRDNMAWGMEECVQRGHHFGIVDEVDSILIDEARTPLIISGPVDQNSIWYQTFARIAPRLRRGEDGEGDYEVDEKKRTIGISEAGVAKVEDELGIENLYEQVNTPLISFLNNSIKAKELYTKDKDYVVMNGEVLIVDEFTGRILHGRRWSEGMHQAVEAKEGVEIKDENQTLATITLQNYFRLYEKLSGMTGTAMTEANEFHQTYQLGVVPIPTNMPMIRTDQSDLVFQSEDAKWEAVVDDIVERHENGQPVLVGTTSVEKSELVSRQLKRRGVLHEVLNAKYHEREAAIIAQAGRKAAVTVATNMAGRGTDIMLGGNPEFLADIELHQRGLSPVDTPEDYEAAWAAAVEKSRKAVADEHGEVVAVGGLYVLGTERHESRRIDNQLRGRSGRQGDPGESRFYLSLADDLMVRFNGDRIAHLMQMLKTPPEMPLESKNVSRAIRSAQHNVEQLNFEIRKDVLKYDDVMNRQRKVVYSERRAVLEGADLQGQLSGMIDNVVDGYVTGETANGFAEEWDLNKLWRALRQLYPISITVDELIEQAGGDRSHLTSEFIAEAVKADAHAAYERRTEELTPEVMRDVERRVVLSVLDRKWREHLYEMDYLREGVSLRGYGQRDPLIEYQREGYDMFTTMMDGIKEESVLNLFNLQVQVQADPIMVDEADGVSAQLGGVAQPALPPQPQPAEPQPAQTQARQTQARQTQARRPAQRRGQSEQPADAAADAELPAGLARGLARPQRAGGLSYSAPSDDGSGRAEHKTAGTAANGSYANVGRNAPCPCGSGRKFKQCHGDPRARQ